MLDQPTVERLAQRLDDAERSKSLIPAFTREYPDLTIEDAYAIQRAWTKLQLSRGRIVKGHKIGLTSKAMQNAVGISEPDYGVLFADMFYPDASPIPFDRFHAPRIEVELAFVLKTPLEGPECTLFDVLNATDYVTPALEILETRMHRVDPVTKAPRKVMDTISDNAANAALVVGGRPIRPLDFDLRWIGALLFRNGQIEEIGIAAGVGGFVLGSLLSQQPRTVYVEEDYDSIHIRRCYARYASYDAGSNTYIGYDGYPHYCRL